MITEISSAFELGQVVNIEIPGQKLSKLTVKARLIAKSPGYSARLGKIPRHNYWIWTYEYDISDDSVGTNTVTEMDLRCWN